MNNRVDLVIIGAGSGGLSAADFAVGIGARVALVEKHRVGGDCTWTGCVPSKALIRAARSAHESRQAARFGVSHGATTVDIAAVNSYVHSTINTVFAGETPAVLRKKGITVVEAAARFVDAHTIQAGEHRLYADHSIISTGAHPATPAINGLQDVPYFTYEDMYSLTTIPIHLIIIGAGPVGTEMAQAWRRLGAQVTVIGATLLPRADHDARNVLEAVFSSEGIRVIADDRVKAVSHDGNNHTVDVAGQRISGDALLVATGRVPNVAGLGLDAAGVRYTAAGVPVDKYLRTNVSHIYAAGDVIGGPQYTHLAGYQATVAARNALLPAAQAANAAVPWAVFTDPEVAQVGLREDEARAAHGNGLHVQRWGLDHNDRAIADGSTAGFVKVLGAPNGKVIGATVVAPHAGDIIGELSLAIAKNVTLAGLADAMLPYPTYSLPIMQLGGRYLVDEVLRNTAYGRLALRLAGLGQAA